MAKIFLMALLGLIAALPARAADVPANKDTVPDKIERGLDKAGKAVGKVADKAVNGVKKGVDKTEKALEKAGNKTGQWIQEKTQ